MKTLKILDGLVSAQKLSPSRIQGCNQEQMESLENHFRCVLPSEYADFMRFGGIQLGSLFVGSDIKYPRVLGLRHEAESLLGEYKKDHLLPRESLVFCMHQGYEINFLNPGSPNPAVWQFVEGDNQCVLIYDSFTDFLSHAISIHLEVFPSCD